MKHSFNATVVSESYIVENFTLLVEMTDGSLLTFKLNGDISKNYNLNWKTKEELVRIVGDYNTDCRLNANINLHNAKVSRLGWDYRSRGY